VRLVASGMIDNVKRRNAKTSLTLCPALTDTLRQRYAATNRNSPIPPVGWGAMLRNYCNASLRRPTMLTLGECVLQGTAMARMLRHGTPRLKGGQL
jgi:hypothetical protein